MVHFSVLFLLFWAAYFAPSIVAYQRGHAQLPAIIAVNLVFGWTVIGWLGCLIWAATGPDPVRPPTIEQSSGPVVRRDS